MAAKSASRSFSCATTAAGARVDETVVAELALGLGDFAFEPGDLLGQAFALRLLVDFNLEHQPQSPTTATGASASGSAATTLTSESLASA